MSHAAEIAQIARGIDHLYVAHPDFLVGWNEIRLYLGISDRAARRWQNRYALPVRRVGRRVVLSKTAVDYWITQIDELQRQRLRAGRWTPRRRNRLTFSDRELLSGS